MPNRTIPPQVHSDFKFNLNQVKCYSIGTHGKLFHHLIPPSCNISKIEVIFPVGIVHQKQPLQAHYTFEMLKYGTKKFSEKQILEQLDRIGTSLNIVSGNFFSYLSIICIKEHFDKALDILHPIITDSVFPKKKLQEILAIDKQEYLIMRENVTYIAKSNLLNALFSHKFPLGVILKDEHFDSLNKKHVVSFFQNNVSKNGIIYNVIGNLSNYAQKKFEEIEKNFGDNDRNISEEIFKPKQYLSNEIIFQRRKNATQSAIFGGCLLPGLVCPDFPIIQFITRILGGYFGSRLMTKLRQEKGYTYGIHASIIAEKYFSILLISTEVRANKTVESINIIKNEIERLQIEPLTFDELEIVRMNELTSVMEQLDGPLSQSKYQTNLLIRNIDSSDFLQNILTTIKQIEPEIIKQSAKKYFNVDNFVFAICGEM